MDRIDRLMEHPVFRDCMDRIELAEKDRSFCLHGFAHSLDVARIGYIINLEEQYGIDREVLYAAALLHDIGRGAEYETGEPHHQAGAVMARQLLEDVGFDSGAVEAICEAISNHKSLSTSDSKGLCALLYKADKLSRNCFCCKAYKECYWQEDKRNRHIIV